MADPSGIVLVSAASVGYVGSIFTRDVFFSVATFLSFWLFIFAPTFFSTSLVTYVMVPASAILAAITGITLVKLLNIGQLIDVWLTGSGGGDNSKGEEMNVPFMILAVGASFVATFFIVTLIEPSPILTVDTTVAWLVAIAFVLLTLIAVLMTGVQIKQGVRFKGRHDYASVYYVFGYIVIMGISLWAWHGLTVAPIARGAWTAAIVGVLDVIVFVGGHVYEGWRDKQMAESRHGRWYSSRDTSAVRLFFRYFLVIGVHVGLFILAGFAIDSAVDITEVFYPWLVAYFGVGFIVFAAVYIIIGLFSFRQNISSIESRAASPPASPPTSPPGETEELLEEGTADAGDAMRQETSARRRGQRKTGVNRKLVF